MFGIGTTELLVILLVGVLVLGPEHLPRIMRTVSKVMSDFRRVSTDFQRTINLEAHKEEWEREYAAASTTKKKKKKKPVPKPPVVADELTPDQQEASSTVVAEDTSPASDETLADTDIVPADSANDKGGEKA